MYQAAANQSDSGERVPAKIVPAVAEARRSQAPQHNSPSPIRQLVPLRCRTTGRRTPPANAAAPDRQDTPRRPETRPAARASSADSRRRAPDAARDQAIPHEGTAKRIAHIPQTGATFTKTTRPSPTQAR